MQMHNGAWSVSMMDVYRELETALEAEPQSFYESPLVVNFIDESVIIQSKMHCLYPSYIHDLKV